jgi:hypothetical protein
MRRSYEPCDSGFFFSVLAGHKRPSYFIDGEREIELLSMKQFCDTADIFTMAFLGSGLLDNLPRTQGFSFHLELCLIFFRGDLDVPL